MSGTDKILNFGEVIYSRSFLLADTLQLLDTHSGLWDSGCFQLLVYQ